MEFPAGGSYLISGRQAGETVVIPAYIHTSDPQPSLPLPVPSSSLSNRFADPPSSERSRKRGASERCHGCSFCLLTVALPGAGQKAHAKILHVRCVAHFRPCVAKLTLLLLAAGGELLAAAQNNNPSEPPQGPHQTAATQVVAIVNGEPVTEDQLEAMIRGLPPNMQLTARKNTLEFLRQYYLMKKLAALAEEEGLHQKSPYKEAILYQRFSILAQAELNEKMQNLHVSHAEMQAYYEQNKDKFLEVRARAIYIPYRTEATKQLDQAGEVLDEKEAEKLAFQIAQRARNGEDFAQLVEKYSKDESTRKKGGDLGWIKRSDPLPEDVRKTLFSLQVGQVSDPVKQPNGFYIFRLEEVRNLSLRDVSPQVYKAIKEKKFKAWLEELKNSITVELPRVSSQEQQGAHK